MLQYCDSDQGPVVKDLVENEKVLVIDDNDRLLDVLQKIFDIHGYEVITALSATQALTELSRVKPDIIVCDIMMPEMNGFDFCAHVRENADWSDIPFIFLTALSDPEEIRYGKEIGCDDYITKPFDPSDLVAVVRGKLTLARHRRRMYQLRLKGYQRRIVHTLSHEFRTPLVSINTGTELLKEQFERMETRNVERLIESIRRGGMRLERLVNDFMLLQRIDQGHESVICQGHRERRPLISIVEIAVDCFCEVFPEQRKRIVVENQCEVDDYPYISVFDLQVVNIVQRLLSNACKFSPPGEEVRVVVAKSNGDAMLSVQDRGPGIEAETDEACQLFTQVKREVYEQQGCGLGLTIANYFIKINGGSLSLMKPEDGIGVRAVVRFPLAD